MSASSPSDGPTGELVVFSLKPDLKPTDRTRLFRQWHGYTDRSNFGRYVYPRPGLLSEIPHVHLTRGAIIVRAEDKGRVTRFLRPWARVQSRTVLLTKRDQQVLLKDHT